MLFSLANQRQFVSELNVTSVFPPSEMFEPVYGFPKQQRNAGKIFGISGLQVALSFGSPRLMKQID